MRCEVLSLWERMTVVVCCWRY